MLDRQFLTSSPVTGIVLASVSGAHAVQDVTASTQGLHTLYCGIPDRPVDACQARGVIVIKKQDSSWTK